MAVFVLHEPPFTISIDQDTATTSAFIRIALYKYWFRVFYAHSQHNPSGLRKRKLQWNM